MAGALGSDKAKTHPTQFFRSVRAFSQIEERFKMATESHEWGMKLRRGLLRLKWSRL